MLADNEVELPIEPAQIMLFARAVGDERWADSVDFGDPADTLAPPTFTQTLQHFIPDYRMRPTARRPWIGSGATPTGAPSAPDTANVLHAEQHFEYHKPVRAGTILRASTRPGARWSKDGRAGRLNFSEEIIDFREPDGSLAVTSRLVEVQVVAREDRTPMTAAPPREPVAVGSAWTVEVVRELTRSQIVQYAGASGDFNPLHTDEVYARQVGGYPSVFAHGMLTMGMTARAVTDVFGPLALCRFGGRFRAQVWPGDSLAVRIEVTGVGAETLLYLTVVTTNQHGIAVFDGTAEVEPAAVLTPPQVAGKLALPNDRLFVSEGME